jgi:dTDP-4-amino-4,6-dideoxygalactose transaminase
MIEVENFERTIANYFGSPFAIATDCCTHAIELCLRYLEPKKVTCPKQTYLSVPMTFMKLNIDWAFNDTNWKDYYYIGNTNIIDAAVYWKQHGYIKDSLMCLSFQYKKHLKLGRGGMILLDNSLAYAKLVKMRYDGRVNNIPWTQQEIDSLGYHYYMTPETAQLGIERFNEIKDVEPQRWSNDNYPDLSKFKVFNNAKCE